MANLYSSFSQHLNSEREFLCYRGKIISYRELDERVAQYAQALVSLGVVFGQRVAVQVEKSPEAIFLYLACLRVGAVYVPLNPAYTPTEVSYFLQDSEPRVFVCASEREDALAQAAASCSDCLIYTLGTSGEGSLARLASMQPLKHEVACCETNSLAAIVYTSGTTGRSKGAMLTHGNLMTNAQTLVDAWSFSSSDVLLHALPLFHVHGLFVGLHTVLLSGARILLLPKFDLETVLRLLPESTVLMGVPTFYIRLLESPRLDQELTCSIRLFISGSAPLLSETHRAFERRTGQQILERYGMTETGMLTSNPLRGKRLPGSVGRPLEGVTLRVTNEQGELLGVGEVGGIEVKGPNVFSGYWKRAPETDFTLDGFFKTGDLGLIDAEGYVHILGRSKDLIISGGFNVYPKEVENVLDMIPGVLESAVVGLPHPDLGEGVVAVLHLEPGSKLQEADVISWARSRLAGYKVPKRAVFAELPRNAMGKVQKNRIREQLKQLFAVGV